MFTSIAVLKACCGIAHHVASKVLVGDELCKDETFKEASTEYFQGHATTGFILLMIPTRFIRSALSRPLSYFQRVKQRRVLDIVSTEMRRRLEARTHDPDLPERVDAIDWSLRIRDDFPSSQREGLLWQMSHELVHLLGAAHAPTGMVLTQMLWQALNEPEYLQALRREAEAAVSKIGYTEKITDHLPLQDSFIAEAFRLYMPNKRMYKIVGRPGTLFSC